MIVKIIGNTAKPYPELVWYADKIGSFYKVESEGEDYFFVYHGKGNEEKRIGAINKCDCKTIEHE